MFETLRLAYLNILHLVLNAIISSSNVIAILAQYISNFEFLDVFNRIQVQIWIYSDVSVAWVWSRDKTKYTLGMERTGGNIASKHEDVINQGVMFVGPRGKYLSVKGSPSWSRMSHVPFNLIDVATMGRRRW